jgi:chain length determinant protein EpsF
MNFQQFISILLARKRLILMIFAIVVGTTTLVSLILPKQYTASVTLVVDFKTPDPISGGLSQAMIMPSYMATQIDIITSDRVSRRVVKTLGFEKVPELVEQWKADSNGQGTLEGYYADILSKKLDVKPSRESNVINIEFTGSDPKSAAAVANAYAQAYLDTNVEIQSDPAKRYADYFVTRTKETQAKMEQEQNALSAYQKANGIISVDERLDVENARLNDLSAQLTVLQAQKSEAQSRQSQARGSLDTNPDVINNPNIQNLRATINAAEGKLQEASNSLGQNHPQIKQQKAELDSLRARLKTEMSNVAASLGTNTQVSVQKESEVRAALEAQKNRVLNIKKQRDEVSVLQTELASTQAEYNNLRQRVSQSSLQSQNQQSSITILTPAFEPQRSSKPKVLLNILVSIFLGVMLGVGSAMLMELTDRRVRSVEDLAEIGIPVLGILTAERPASPRWKFWRQ